jgi:hypothetical protein
MTSGPTLKTIKRLFALSGNRCAFPECPIELVHEGTTVGEICHIKAQKPDEPRYDPQQSDQERHSFENLILLCGTHHTVIDGDEEVYTVQRVTDMKRTHEASVTKMSDEDVSQRAMALMRVAQRLKCSFDMNDPACLRPNTEITFIQAGDAVFPQGVTITISSLRPLFTQQSIRSTYFRLKVETESVAVVAKCRGRLLSITRDGQNLLGEPLILPFAPSENLDSLSKEIHQGIPEYVDFLAITDGNMVLLTPPKHHHPSSVKYENIFSRPGEYMLILHSAPLPCTTCVSPRGGWATC